jgi:hypothetical protein
MPFKLQKKDDQSSPKIPKEKVSEKGTPSKKVSMLNQSLSNLNKVEDSNSMLNLGNVSLES